MFFMIYGIPEKILSDQGCNFESNLIQELCRLAQVKRLRTTPYKPQTNGQYECFRGTLISMIGTLDTQVKWHWPEETASMMYAYYCTRNNATWYSTYLLMFGCKPLLPIDVKFGVHTPDVADVSSTKHIDKIQKWIKWAFEQVNVYNEKEINHAKKCYNQNVRCSALVPGDLVLVHVRAFKGKHKVSDWWECFSYEAIRCIRDDLPVYKVRQKDSNLPSWVLHQNMPIPLIQRQESELSEVVPMDSHLADGSNSDNVHSPGHTGPVT